MRERETLLKEKYVSVQTMKRGYGYGCVYVCVIINQISSRQLLVCVCYRSTPGRAVNARNRCVCVRAHVRLRVGMSVCPASSLSRQQLLVCVCVYMYANTAKRLRLHKTVILLLIMKYFVLKMISYSHTTAPWNLLSSPRKTSQTLSPDMSIIILPSIIREA